jgi:hypothetical protein
MDDDLLDEKIYQILLTTIRPYSDDLKTFVFDETGILGWQTQRVHNHVFGVLSA